MMKEDKGEVVDLQRQERRNCGGAIRESYAILSKSSDDVGAKMSDRSRGIRSLKNRHIGLEE